jgi:hypothetical protein
MTSIYAKLFLAIQQRILTIQDANSNALLRYVAQDVGQLEYYIAGNGGKPPVSWPCALIDISDVRYTDMSDNCQMGTATVIIRLGFPPLEGTASDVISQKYRQKALYYYEIEAAVQQVLHGWRPDTVDIMNSAEDIETLDLTAVFGALSRVSASTETREDFIRVRVLNYTIGLEDMSLATQYITVPVTLDLTVDFE